jgi:hypothetical protein
VLLAHQPAAVIMAPSQQPELPMFPVMYVQDNGQEEHLPFVFLNQQPLQNVNINNAGAEYMNLP